jgi:threonyl-tRNA synthetase
MKGTIKIICPDGREENYRRGITAREVLKELGGIEGLVAAKVNGRVMDLDTKIEEPVRLEPVTLRSKDGVDIYRHSTSHVMAQAVKELFDDAKLAIGPTIKDGFYYDFDAPRPFTPEDLKAIEKRMGKIIKKDLPFSREELSRDDALRVYRERGEI